MESIGGVDVVEKIDKEACPILDCLRDYAFPRGLDLLKAIVTNRKIVEGPNLGLVYENPDLFRVGVFFEVQRQAFVLEFYVFQPRGESVSQKVDSGIFKELVDTFSPEDYQLLCLHGALEVTRYFQDCLCMASEDHLMEMTPSNVSYLEHYQQHVDFSRFAFERIIKTPPEKVREIVFL